MANPYPNRELDMNCSVPVAVFRFLQRQPWKSWAATTWEAASRLLLSALLATSLAALLATAAHARTYDAVNADVPFKFTIGKRTFRPGHYQIVVVGNGLLALRDERLHVVASLITRTVETKGPSPASKLVFHIEKKRPRLTRILLENRTQALEVLGEELAMPRPNPVPAEAPRWTVDSMFERSVAPGLRY